MSPRPTRRDVIKYGGIAGGAGMLAGCAGDTGTDDATPEPTDSLTETATPEAGTPEQAAWTVRMEPRTEVTFESVPEFVVVYRADYADMLVSLGHADALAGMQDRQSVPAAFTDQLPGVSVDTESVTPLQEGGEYDKEVFYEIDADLHLVDPNNAKVYFEFDEADITELETNVAPWLGSFIRRPQENIGPGYPHYTLYQAFEKVAAAFREEARYEALAAVHDELLTTIAEERPPESERPSVGLAFLVPGDQFVDSGVFYLSDPTQPGMATKQYQDLGVANAWAEAGVESDGQVGYEELLEADPDVLIAHNAFGYTDSIEDFGTRVVDIMADDDLGSELTAVQNGRVYRGGKNVQGPIVNMFQTEMAAKQLYPETFGEWRGLGEIPESEHLFDRQRVADIVRGEF